MLRRLQRRGRAAGGNGVADSRTRVEQDINDALSESLPGAPPFQAKVRRQYHTNLLEAAASVALLYQVPLDRRTVIGQDPEVTKGTAARGRSGSPLLDDALAAGVLYILGKSLRPVSFHAPTWSLRADEVSRYTPIRAPRMAAPRLRRLAGGCRHEGGSSWARRAGGAGRLAGGLCWALWLCGVSAAPRRGPPLLRSREQMRQGHLSKTVASTYEEVSRQFRRWLDVALPDNDVKSLTSHHSAMLAEWVEEFLTQSYISGRGRTEAANAVLATQGRHQAVRASSARLGLCCRHGST